MCQDVTLHVGPKNTAMLLFQKFGFKSEEYLIDFYKKYNPVDGDQLNAFKMRLRR